MTVRIGVLISGILLWLLLYFVINRLDFNKPGFDWSTRLDENIPFIPQLFAVYLSTYVFGLLPFFLISETRLFLGIVYGYILITGISTLIHVVFPSQVKRKEIFKPNRLSMMLIVWYQQLCRPYDNFPSTHVAFSIIVVGTCFLTKGAIYGSIFLVWGLSIAISTLMTKQHYVLDILSGGLLGMAVFSFIFLLN